jgi:hypothetical protein
MNAVAMVERASPRNGAAPGFAARFWWRHSEGDVEVVSVTGGQVSGGLQRWVAVRTGSAHREPDLLRRKRPDTIRHDAAHESATASVLPRLTLSSVATGFQTHDEVVRWDP